MVMPHNRRLAKQNKCGNCLRVFAPWETKPDAQYCSRTCAGQSRRNRLTFDCVECGKRFDVQVNQADRYNVKYCSRACKGAGKRRQLLGAGAPWYKGGFVGRHGYKVISVDSKKYLEHRYVMAQHLDRPLTKAETVHHIDGNKLNNDINNLQLMSYRDHQLLHWKQKRETGNWR